MIAIALGLLHVWNNHQVAVHTSLDRSCFGGNSAGETTNVAVQGPSRKSRSHPRWMSTSTTLAISRMETHRWIQIPNEVWNLGCYLLLQYTLSQGRNLSTGTSSTTPYSLLLAMQQYATYRHNQTAYRILLFQHWSKWREILAQRKRRGTFGTPNTTGTK